MSDSTTNNKNNSQNETKVEQQHKTHMKTCYNYKRVCATLQDLITSTAKNAVYIKRLSHKNWRLYILKRNNNLIIRVQATINSKNYTRLSVTIDDVHYLQDLLNLIEKSFKEIGIKLEKL
ncbi:MAG: hypothetical protein QXF61_07945 [Nitrososphaeria archaeon]